MTWFCPIVDWEDQGSGRPEGPAFKEMGWHAGDENRNQSQRKREKKRGRRVKKKGFEAILEEKDARDFEKASAKKQLLECVDMKSEKKPCFHVC